MPRESVYGRELAIDVATSDSLMPDPESIPLQHDVPVVDVFWQKDQGFAQVVTMAQSAKPIVLRAPQSALEKITVIDGAGLVRCGSSVGDIATSGSIDIVDEWSITSAREGYYVELDRQGINALIRKLRRARDEAFGKDE